MREIVRKRERAAQKEKQSLSKTERDDVRDSRDIQSLIAIVRVRKEPEQAFQDRAGRS